MTAESYWITLTEGSDEHRLEAIDSPNSQFTGAYRHGKSGEDGLIAIFRDGEPTFHRAAAEPRSIGIANTGRLIVADWIEYGESTGADINVYELEGWKVYHEHIDGSSPLVDISPDGMTIVVCPYNEAARIIDAETAETQQIHQYGIGDRLAPRFIESDGDTLIEFASQPGEDALYRINLDGDIVWKSDTFDQRQYHDIVSLNESIDWDATIEKCAGDYTSTENPKLKNTIANTIADARLVDASPAKLEEVIDVLERYQTVFTKDQAHEKLLSLKLGEAYYRLAKRRGKGTKEPSGFWDLVEASGNEYKSALPWYDAKEGLAKVLRYQAKKYRRHQRHPEAFSCYKQIDALERRFDVGLLTDADTKRLEEYGSKGVSMKQPPETGRFTTQ
jgi:hypothetical protein